MYTLSVNLIPALGEFDNATDLDAFYIAASQGWDYETGEVFDLRLHKYYAAQGFPTTERVEPKIELDIPDFGADTNDPAERESNPFAEEIARDIERMAPIGWCIKQAIADQAPPDEDLEALHEGGPCAYCHSYNPNEDPENMAQFWAENEKELPF